MPSALRPHTPVSSFPYPPRYCQGLEAQDQGKSAAVLGLRSHRRWKRRRAREGTQGSQQEGEGGESAGAREGSQQEGERGESLRVSRRVRERSQREGEGGECPPAECPSDAHGGFYFHIDQKGHRYLRFCASVQVEFVLAETSAT